MEKRHTYTPAKAEIIHFDTTDVITTSGFKPDLLEGEWDSDM